MTTACSDDDNNGNEGSGGGNGNGNVPVTTGEQAQEEIDRVGKALAAKIDVERLKPTISLLEYCENTFFNEDVLKDYFREIMKKKDWCFATDIRLPEDEFAEHLKGMTKTTNRGIPIYIYANSGTPQIVTKLRKSGIKLPMHR